MDDTPYTTPDEDPFNVIPLLQQPRRRRSSMLDKWIKEQQIPPSSTKKSEDTANDARSVTSVNPYLAYPDLARISLERTKTRDDASTINSYDLLEDEDIPPNTPDTPQMPGTPTSPRSGRQSRSLLTPTSFRTFSLSFRSSSPAVSNETASPRRLSRMSLFTRSSHPSPGTVSHQRSTSLTTTPVSTSGHPSKIQVAEAGPSRWRPSVLGHFSPAPSSPSIAPSESNFRPPRPSISSGDTFGTQTSATTLENYSCYTPSKPSFAASIRSRNLSRISMFHTRTDATLSGTVCSQSPVSPRDIADDIPCVQSMHTSGSSSTLPSRVPFGPKPASYLNTFADLDDDEARNEAKKSADKHPAKSKTPRPSIAYSSGGTLSRVGFSSLSSRGQKKKKKLVVSGVGTKDVRKFEGVKRWCENFGEVRQITRMPNGDLHVDFLRADVADTVCRLRAGVYIAGVGSVQLSWFSGYKR